MQDDLYDYALLLKVEMVKNCVTQKDVATELGYKHYENFNRALRNGIHTEEKRDKILNAIQRVAERRKNESKKSWVVF